MRSLTFKLTLAFVVTAAVAIIVAALLIRKATTQEFGQYLKTTRAMEQAMGGVMGDMMHGSPMMGMMGVPEQGFLHSVNRYLWWAGLAAVASALILSLGFSRQITVPLRQLAQAARRIARGDLSQRVEVRTRDEVGELASAFNSMAESLRRSEDLRHQMMADVVHELRTPLTTIQGRLEAMLDGVAPVTPEALASLHSDSLLLARLVTDLRDLSLAEGGQLKLHPELVDLGDIIRGEVASVQPEAQERKVSIVVEPYAGATIVWVDPDRARQVLRNLLNNALRYTPACGSIAVGIQNSLSGFLTVAVSDSGRGIATEDLPHVFERFYRGREFRRQDGGSGIGLAIVKQLAEGHGGRVWAESTLGRGSTFYFALPLTQPKS
ncbi:MAG: HAMP domain-containing histidine kinase [Chloroflexi bacterium]|nr:HAMP domain-containing histidine kinase [Chloroflexota bacterium]